MSLTVTARGQVTIRKDVLKHLGVPSGDKVRLDLLPDGRAELTANQPRGLWRALRGFLQGKTGGARLSIQEINETIAQAGGAARLGRK